MNNQTIVCCVVALLLGMLLANMLNNVCGCKLTEGYGDGPEYVTESGLFRLHTEEERADKHLRKDLHTLGEKAFQAQRERNKKSHRQRKDRLVEDYLQTHQ